jgi:hypothetical protein
MKTLILAFALTFGLAATADAQCPNCKPQPQVQAAPVPGYLFIRQRRGVFGWRCSWVAVPTTFQPVQRVPAVYIW